MWVVAYAFVPLGEYARERTYIVLILAMLGLYAGIPAIQPLAVSSKEASKARKIAEAFAAFSKRGLRVVCFVVALGVFWTGQRWVAYDKGAIQPYHPQERILTAGIWTIHFGLDDDMYASHVRMANILRELELDVIGILFI